MSLGDTAAPLVWVLRRTRRLGPERSDLEAMRSEVADRIAGLADKTADLTKSATTSAVEAGKAGLAKAAKIGLWQGVFQPPKEFRLDRGIEMDRP